MDLSQLVSAAALAGYSDLVRSLGGDPALLLAACGIDGDESLWEGRAFLFLDVARLLENTAKYLKCADFGLRLAQAQDGARALGEMQGLVKDAPTLGSATRATIRHFGMLSSVIRERLEYNEENDLFALRFDFRIPGTLHIPQIVEKTLLVAHNSALDLTGGTVRSQEVWLLHRPQGSAASYRRWFGSTVRFNQEYSAVFFSGDDLRRQIVGGNPDRFQSEVARASSRQPAGERFIDEQVADALADLMAHGVYSGEEIAERLDLTTRTLHRKLRARHTNFETVRDHVRRELALRYLGDADLPLTDAAARLGYSELAVLSRSCQRWFGCTPGKLRKALTGRDHMPPGVLPPQRALEKDRASA